MRLKKCDYLIIFIVLFLAASIVFFCFDFSGQAKYCEITENGELIHKIRLMDGYKDTILIETEHGYNVVEIDGLSVAVVEADCYDRVCVNTGVMSKAGQAAVCLPNRVVVRIVGDDNNQVDAIT